MLEMKFAFIFTSNSSLNKPVFQMINDDDSKTVFCMVDGIEEGIKEGKVLIENGYNMIELCGAFNKECADKLADFAQGSATIGYVTRSDDQIELFNKLFSNNK